MSKIKTIKKAYTASRAVPVIINKETNAPASLDENTRSVEVIASTEKPAFVFDWDYGIIEEVLLMSGCRMPKNGQLVFLDSHSRESVKRVLGSFRSLAITETEHGKALIGKTVYSSDKEAESAFLKVKEGHITDVSVGYEVHAHIMIESGQSTTIEGQVFNGPLRVAIDWEPKELSLCPIGADSNAKVRQNNLTAQKVRAKKEKNMGKKSLLARLKALLFGKRADLEIVDDAGDDVNLEDLTEAELTAVLDDVQDILSEAENMEVQGEPARMEDDKPTEKPDTAEKSAVRNYGSKQLTVRQATQAERARVLAIQTMARAHNVPAEIEQEMINKNMTLDQAKAKVLDMRSSQISSGPGFSVNRIDSGRSESEKFRAAANDALLMRCGVQIEKMADGANELQGYSMRELCREFLHRNGRDTKGSSVQLVGRALSTTDLPNLLIETSRRVLMEGYDQAPETWQTWCQTGSVADFKKTKSIGVEGDVKLKLKPEGGEYQEGLLAEIAEEYQIATFGRKMLITREALINDDLNALTQLPRMYGQAAAELVGDVAYQALLNAPLMGDGKALFNADHLNLQSGSGGTPDVTKLGKAVTAMKLQKDSLGNYISFMPKFFLAPVALEVAAEQFFNTQIDGKNVIGDQASPFINNPYGGNYFTRIYDRRLDQDSATSTYIAALRNTITVYFLGGVQAPYIEEDINFNSDAIESKVRLDVGAKALSWKTMQKMTA